MRGRKFLNYFFNLGENFKRDSRKGKKAVIGGKMRLISSVFLLVHGERERSAFSFSYDYECYDDSYNDYNQYFVRAE